MPTHTHPFSILRPRSLREASEMLAEGGDDAVAYAGGTELLLAMKQGGLRFDSLVDLKTIPGLATIVERGGGLEIGALATHREISRSPLVRERYPALARLESRIANPRVRATGTLGGNLVFAEPHSSRHAAPRPRCTRPDRRPRGCPRAADA